MAYYVYILASRRHGTLYIGVTNDLVRRVYEHQASAVPGFTTRYGVDKLAWFEIFEDATSAMRVRKSSRSGAVETATDRRAKSQLGMISTAESRTDARGYGFRARRFAPPRNDGGGAYKTKTPSAGVHSGSGLLTRRVFGCLGLKLNDCA